MAGKKNNKKKSKSNKGFTTRDLQYKTDGQEYAKIIKVNGDCRFDCLCIDGKIRLGHIRGSLKKRSRIVLNDIVLVSLREFQDRKCDIILQYKSDEIRKLKKFGEIPDNIKLKSDEEEDGVEKVFAYDFDAGSGSEKEDSIDLEEIWDLNIDDL